MAHKKLIIGIVAAVAIIGGLYALGLSVGSTNSEGNQPPPEQASPQPVQDTPAQDAQNDLEAKRLELLKTYPWMEGWMTASNVAFSGTQEYKDSELAKVHGPNALFIEVLTHTGWTGVAQGSDFVQESDDGFGFAVKTVPCEPGGIYSIVYQKSTDTGDMRIVVYKDGQVLKHGYTDADYGVVSVSGTC
jgi:hypothetical protein